MNFKRFCDNVVEAHIKKMQEPLCSDIPFVIITYKKGNITMKPFLYSDGSPMDYAQQVIDKESPEMYVIASEAWMKKVTHETLDEYTKKYKWGDIIQDDSKEECLIFIGKTIDGTQAYSRIFRIIRHGTEIIYDEIKDKDNGNPAFESHKLT